MSQFAKIAHDDEKATQLSYMIVVADNPGADGLQPPHHTILCEGMYDWAADWLLGVLEGADFPG